MPPHGFPHCMSSRAHSIRDIFHVSSLSNPRRSFPVSKRHSYNYSFLLGRAKLSFKVLSKPHLTRAIVTIPRFLSRQSSPGVLAGCLLGTKVAHCSPIFCRLLPRSQKFYACFSSLSYDCCSQLFRGIYIRSPFLAIPCLD